MLLETGLSAKVWESLLTNCAMCTVRGGQRFEQFVLVIIN
jgi:hypothetical protein